jgi:hypothetical protein
MAPDGGNGAGVSGGRRLGEGARAALGFAAVLLAAAAIAVPVTLLVGGSDPPEVPTEEVVAAGRDPGGEADPFAWSQGRRSNLESRAAAAFSHVLYTESPGGVIASARRTARWRNEIETAVGSTGIDPGLLEAMVFLESAGRPEVIAGSDVEAAAGLTQILASTGTALLGMEIDIARSRMLTRKMARASRRGDEREYRALSRERAAVDERFDPEEALAGAVRYLAIGRERFGRDDLAIVSYHMGIGNLEDVVRAYSPSEAPAREIVESEDLSYAQLYFDSSPVRNAEAWSILSEFADDSATYLWRVLAAQEVMRLYREDRDQLAELSELHLAKATQEEVFHPAGETEVYEEPGDVEDAREEGELVALPEDPSLGFRVAEQMGELAPEIDQVPELYAALRPEALATLIYLSSQVRETGDATRPLRVTSTVRDLEYQELLVGENPEATSAYSLHTPGWSFDILRDYEDRDQGRAFQFALDRLKALNVLDYAYEPAAIHITVSQAAAPLVED